MSKIKAALEIDELRRLATEARRDNMANRREVILAIAVLALLAERELMADHETGKVGE